MYSIRNDLISILFTIILKARLRAILDEAQCLCLLKRKSVCVCVYARILSECQVIIKLVQFYVKIIKINTSSIVRAETEARWHIGMSSAFHWEDTGIVSIILGILCYK